MSALSLWDPKYDSVDANDGGHSISQQWYAADDSTPSDLQTVEGGWIVDPRFETTDPREPHLFVFWTARNYQDNDCYNLECSGSFILKAGSPYYPGMSLAGFQISQPGGKQVAVPMAWYMDKSGDWILSLNGQVVGEYAAANLKHGGTNPRGITNGATEIQFGGEVASRPRWVANRNGFFHTDTEMGSGSVPLATNNFGKVAFQSNLSYILAAPASNNIRLVDIPQAALTWYEDPHQPCYSGEWGVPSDEPTLKTHFFFGGPPADGPCLSTPLQNVPNS
jgi:hypothetical protein